MRNLTEWLVIIALGVFLSALPTTIFWLLLYFGIICGLEGIGCYFGYMLLFILSIPFSLIGGLYISNKLVSKFLKIESKKIGGLAIVVSIVSIATVVVLFSWLSSP